MSRLRRFGTPTQLLLDAVVVGYFLPIGMMFVGVSRFVREELGGTDFVVGLATTIFFVSAIPARPLAGRAMDRIGRRRFVWPPLIGMGLTTLLIPAATATWMVVVLRLVQGAVGSVLYTGLAAMATDLSPPERRGAAMARLSVMVYLGFAVGPSIGEYLFDHHHWLLFAVAGGMTLLAGMLALRLPETRPVAAAASGEAVVAAVHVPWREMFRAVTMPGVAQFTVGFGYACLISFLTKYSRAIGLGSSGWLFLTFAVFTLLVRAVGGPLGDRIGYAAVALPGVVAIGLGLAGMALASESWMAYPSIALVGIGFGGSFPALTAIAAQDVPDSARGAALGAFFSFNDFGNAIAGPLVGAVSDAAGFRWAYGMPAIVMVVGVATGIRLLRTHRRVAAAA